MGAPSNIWEIYFAALQFSFNNLLHKNYFIHIYVIYKELPSGRRIANLASYATV